MLSADWLLGWCQKVWSNLRVLGLGDFKCISIFVKIPWLRSSGFDWWVSSGVFWSTFVIYLVKFHEWVMFSFLYTRWCSGASLG